MPLSFLPLDLPTEQDLLIDWLSNESWPFHVNAHLSCGMILDWIQSGTFTGSDQQTFWIFGTSGDRIGLIRLYDLDDCDDGYPLFDLRILSAYRGQGIGRQALQWLTRYLFETWPQLNRVVGTTRHDNLAMQRVFVACGYVQEGHFRQDWRTAGAQRYDTLQYAILRQDWETQVTPPISRDQGRDRGWTIRPYQDTDEPQWLRCRVLAFLDTAYFDNVEREKERYANPAIELVAEQNGQIIGLINIEYEVEPGRVCSPPATSSLDGKAGMIWNLAVHPDYRRRGIGKALLDAAVHQAKQAQLVRLEVWTRDDAATLHWYEAQGFQKIDTYLHVYVQDDEVKQRISSAVPGLCPVSAFAHYQGDSSEVIRQQFRRVHECNRYDLSLR